MAKKLAKKKKALPVARKAVSQKPKKKLTKKVAVKRKKKVLAIPKGYHSITPYLIINNASKAIDFYKKAFGAKEVMRMEHPGGKVGHAELKIGDAIIMLADECQEMNTRSPQAYGGSPVSIYLYVKNVDDIVKTAVSAGATILSPVENMFYGDRSGTLEDPHGHRWHISTHIEDVSAAKMKKRVAELFNKKS
jgi:PhnB protein